MAHTIDWWRKRARASLARTERAALTRSRWLDWLAGVAVVGAVAVVIAAAAVAV